jgi:hypothetical protein
MSEKKTVEAVAEVIEEAVEEIIEEAEREPNWKVMRPGGTRDFPDGGAVQVRNDTDGAGRYTTRLEGGQTVQRTISPGALQGYNAQVHFYLKNNGSVDLMVNP